MSPGRRDFAMRRRQFLAGSIRLWVGLGAAGMAAVGPRLGSAGAADSAARQVLIEDLVDPRSQRAASVPRGSPPTSSTTLQARRPFTHVGLHWYGPPEVPVELQTSSDGLAWTAWRRLVVERTPGETPRAGETFSALVGAPRHRFVRYRLLSTADSIGDVTATCLNSLDGPRLTTGTGASLRPLALLGPRAAFADGADFRTGIITREQWGADESLRFDVRGVLWEPAYVAPRMVVVHHTATDNDYVDAAAEVRAIYTYHAVTQEFGDIGYNALIDRDGRIYEGRRGREEDPFGRLDRDVLSFGVVAGHAFDYNYGSLGIALLGSYQAGTTPPEAMLTRLEDLLVFEHGRHQIDPRLEIDFVRASRLWRYDLMGLSGHRDCNNTECPGDAVYERLGGLRERVVDRLGGAPQPVRAIRDVPVGRNTWLGVAAYGWSGPAPYDRVFEGFQREIGKDPAGNITGYDERGMPEHVLTTQRAAAYTLSQPGQYTLHLRPHGSPFADRRTVLADHHVVRDNADGEGTERQGAWTRSRNVLQFHGADYEVADEDSGGRFAWELAAPEPGRYVVQACWAAGTDRSKAAVYRFGAAGGEARPSTVDQTRNGGVWVNLGELDLNPSETCRVELAASKDGVVIADAVRLLLLSPA